MDRAVEQRESFADEHDEASNIDSHAGGEHQSSSAGYQRKKRNCLLFLLAWGVAAGFASGAVSVDLEPIVMLADLIVFLIAVIKWTGWDAAQRGFTLWRYFVPMIVICPGPLILMPAYFIQSRGWMRGTVASLLGLAFLLLQLGIDSIATEFAIDLFWDE